MSHLTVLSSSYINTKYERYGFTMEINKDTFLPLRIDGYDKSLINGIRRCCTSEIPNYTFDAKIEHNTSQYNTEVIIDRLQLVTIDQSELEKHRQDPENLRFFIANPQDHTKPFKNTTQKIMKLYLHDHILQQGGSEAKIVIKSLCPHNSLLMTLNPQEEIHAEITLIKGTGLQHARWQSGISMYKFVTKYDLNPTARFGYIWLNSKFMEEQNYQVSDLRFVISAVKNTTADTLKISLYEHVKVYHQDGKKPLDITKLCSWNVNLYRLAPQDEIPATEIILSKEDHFPHPDEQKGIVMYRFEPKGTGTGTGTGAGVINRIETNQEQLDYLGAEQRTPVSIILTIESIGKMKSSALFFNGVEALKNKLEFVASHLTGTDRITYEDDLIPRGDNKFPLLTKFKFVGEEHTMGNILEYYCLEVFRNLIASQGQPELLLEIISGYRKVHPLDNVLELILRQPLSKPLVFTDPHDEYDENPNVRVLVLALEHAIKDCNQLMKEASTALKA